MRSIRLILLFFISNHTIFAQNNYFFSNKKFNPSVPSPEAFLGYEIGSHHTRYDKLVEYMYVLAKTSNRV